MAERAYETREKNKRRHPHTQWKFQRKVYYQMKTERDTYAYVCWIVKWFFPPCSVKCVLVHNRRTQIPWFIDLDVPYSSMSAEIISVCLWRKKYSGKFVLHSNREKCHFLEIDKYAEQIWSIQKISSNWQMPC